MDALRTPAFGALAEEPGIGALAEGRPTPADEMVADVIVDRDEVMGMARGGDGLADLGGERGRDALVGVDLENPAVTAGCDAGVAPVALALPGALDQAVGELRGDSPRAVGAAVEHDDDLVGEAQALQARSELRRLVMDDDERRKARWLSHGARGRCRAAGALTVMNRTFIARE